MNEQRFYPIGTPGQPWGDAERAEWLSRQVRHRSYADEVEARILALATRFQVDTYGEVSYQGEHFALHAVRVGHWRDDLPYMLVTGGVHGYETSGVHGALQFLETRAADYAERVNLLCVPCISPWAYERIHRWNGEAVDPNRSFKTPSAARESAALMRLLAPIQARFIMHIDLHETTDTDETEYRPALSARDGKPFEPDVIPDGFYLVDDADKPQPAFQQAIIAAVSQVTHIAPADDQGNIIGSPVVSPGVIEYAFKQLGLCAGVTDAPYTTTTEVYPDSSRATPEQCNAAQVAAVCAAIEFALAAASKGQSG
ncbi:peptidase [Ahniella affigens]|uniref:Peptidase n=1 Tax=Ahniella affigens TaxID=2021234 RepID=A0A2P1PNW8_9GAMM|nr:M14 family metallocarboxypeptidase [Ahniella affigens]AVP96540.1 peptidase [Ahniella affigens]